MLEPRITHLTLQDDKDAIFSTLSPSKILGAAYTDPIEKSIIYCRALQERRSANDDLVCYHYFSLSGPYRNPRMNYAERY